MEEMIWTVFAEDENAIKVKENEWEGMEEGVHETLDVWAVFFFRPNGMILNSKG
jgi:hypothetical protein